MNNFLKFIIFISFCMAFGCNYSNPIQNSDAIPKPSQFNEDFLQDKTSLFPISASKASEIAGSYLKLDGENQKQLRSCDSGLFYRVVHINSQTEVSVSKTTGDVLLSESIKPNFLGEQRKIERQELPVNQQSAVNITRRHFLDYSKKELYSDQSSLDNYLPVVCDVGNDWMVSFVLKDIKNVRTKSDIGKLPNHTAPNYIINKDTGDIIYFNYLIK